MVNQKFGLIWLVFLIAPLNMGKARELAQDRRFRSADDNIDAIAALNERTRRKITRKFKRTSSCDTVGFTGFCRADLEDALAYSDGLCAEFLQDLQSDCVADERVANEEQATQAKAVIRDKCEDICGVEKCKFFDTLSGDCASSTTVYYHTKQYGVYLCSTMKFMGCMGVENKFDNKTVCKKKCGLDNNAAPSKREEV